MTEKNGEGNAGKKQMGQSDLSLSHANISSFFENNQRHRDDSRSDRSVQMKYLAKLSYFLK